MNELIGHLKGVLIYLDDVLIASNNNENYENTLREFIKIFEMNDIVINFNKGQFVKKNVKYLGHIQHDGYMKADLCNFNERLVQKVPKNKREIRALTGYLNWFRPYIADMSLLMSDLNEKLKDKKF